MASVFRVLEMEGGRMRVHVNAELGWLWNVV
jgi:hypothetical protein